MIGACALAATEVSSKNDSSTNALRSRRQRVRLVSWAEFDFVRICCLQGLTALGSNGGGAPRPGLDAAKASEQMRHHTRGLGARVQRRAKHTETFTSIYA